MRNEYKNQMANKIAANYINLEERIIQDIVRRIKKTGEITSTADWQINRLRIIGYSTEDIEKMLKETLNKSYPEMFELYDNVINWEYVRNKDIYEQINAEYIPFKENNHLLQMIETITQQGVEDLENVTRSLGFYIDQRGQKILTPLSQVYTKYLDNACYDIVSGAFDYGSVLRRTITQLTNSGLRTIDYASGRHNRVDVAARRAVMTGLSQITGKITDYNAKKMGTDFFEVAWHAGARPTHAVWQGKVWTKEQLVSVCGLGTVTGLLGANCYHEYYPFFPGISERNWTDQWLEEKNQEENEPKEFDGKQYTVYEAKQRQRKMETAMRAQREKVRALEKGKADRQEIMLHKAKYQAQLNEYTRFSKKMKLRKERERIYLDMQGKVATNSKKQNALFPPEMIKNASMDVRQYKHYKDILGDNAPSLVKFGQMKYNDSKRFELFQDYTNSIKSGMISPLSDFKNYVALYNKVNREIVGRRSFDGIKITGQRKHLIERVIGTMSDPKTKKIRSGVSIDAITDALEHPIKMMEKVDQEGRKSKKYIGRIGTVTLNPDTGELIQCNPTEARFRKGH